MINDACEDSPANMKCVDDFTLIESRRLTQQPHIQDALNDFSIWTKNSNMKLNPAKCCTNYNDSDVLQTPPPPGPSTRTSVYRQLNVVTEAKILGVVIQANLKWECGTAIFCK